MFEAIFFAIDFSKVQIRVLSAIHYYITEGILVKGYRCIENALSVANRHKLI